METASIWDPVIVGHITPHVLPVLAMNDSRADWAKPERGQFRWRQLETAGPSRTHTVT